MEARRYLVIIVCRSARLRFKNLPPLIIWVVVMFFNGYNDKIILKIGRSKVGFDFSFYKIIYCLTLLYIIVY